jgi:hypothetical protein
MKNTLGKDLISLGSDIRDTYGLKIVGIVVMKV